MDRILRPLLLVLCVATYAAADPITFTFSGSVEEYQVSPTDSQWNVKGLPYDDGDAVSGWFSYTPGPVSSPATLAFTLGHDAFEVSGSAFAWVSWGNGSWMLVQGYSEAFNAAVALVFVGSPNILGCFSSSELCSWYIDGRALPQVIDVSRWTMAELQIRQGAPFGTHVYSRNDNASVFLNAPIHSLSPVTNQTAMMQASLAQTPEPGTILLLGSGLVLLALVASRKRAATFVGRKSS